MKNSTLKTIGQAYAWVLLPCVVLYFSMDDWSSGLTVLAKSLVFLGFLYGKNNWRMLVIILGAIGALASISAMDNIWYLLDISGNSAIAWYALKERK